MENTRESIAQNSILAPFPRALVSFFGVFRPSLQFAVLLGLLPPHSTCPRVTVCKRTGEGSTFPVCYVPCIFHQLQGRRGSVVAEKPWCWRGSWRLSSSTSSSRCSTTSAGSKNSGMLLAPLLAFLLLATSPAAVLSIWRKN